MYSMYSSSAVHISKNNFKQDHEENQKVPYFYQLFVRHFFKNYPFCILLQLSDITAKLAHIKFYLIMMQPFLGVGVQVLKKVFCEQLVGFHKL